MSARMILAILATVLAIAAGPGFLLAVFIAASGTCAALTALIVHAAAASGLGFRSWRMT